MDTIFLQENETLEAARILCEGGLVAIPTETVYGLAANALDEKAVACIFEAKGRPQDNPLIVHISQMDDLVPLVTHIPETAKALAEAFWPGALTMIFHRSALVPSIVSAGLDTVAVRMPSCPITRDIIQKAGVPLAAPSANMSGSPSPTTASHVKNDLAGRVNAIVMGSDCTIGLESTVLDMTSKTPLLLRPGGITVEQIESVVEKIDIAPSIFRDLVGSEAVKSPGMKYRHYAPKAPVILIEGKQIHFTSYVNMYANKNTSVLCFDEESVDLQGLVFPYGTCHDHKTQAQKLFTLLRQADTPKTTAIFVHAPSPDGLGLAVYNRLIKAAGYNVVRLPQIIGITGPIGAGKSSIAAYFNKLFPVVDADHCTHYIVEEKLPEVLAEAFGRDILTSDGCLDRKKLAQKAFVNKENTEKLNAITHPAITEYMDEQTNACFEAGHFRCFWDASQLFEAGNHIHCQHIIGVVAEDEIRLQRVMERDGISKENALMRMKVQKSNAFFRENCDILIENNGTHEELITKLEAIQL